MTGPDPAGNYSVKFWDWIGSIPLTGKINPATSIERKVWVNKNILLDENRKPGDSTGSYGGSCNIPDEMWPAIYEKAYAKFCLYKKGGLTERDLGDPSVDPQYDEMLRLTKSEWGGNAICTMMYLTGSPCFIYNSNGPFEIAGGSRSTDLGSAYNFIRGGFCIEETANTYAKWRTRYPMAAWTYQAEAPTSPAGAGRFNSYSPAGLYDPVTNPGGILFDPDANGNGNGDGIGADHCYSILGVYEPGNNKKYILLRNPSGIKDPRQAILTPWITSASVRYPVQLYPIGSTAQLSPRTCAQAKLQQTSLDLSIMTDGIFGLEDTQFSKYFSSFGWAQGY